MDKAWLIWDIVAVAIIVMCISKGAKNGAVRTIMNSLSYIIAIIAAKIFSSGLAQWLYDNVVSDLLRSSLAGTVRETMAKNGSINEVWANAPLWIKGIIALIPAESVKDVDISSNITAVVDSLMQNVLREPMLWILSALIFVLMFMILSVTIRQIAKVFTVINKIPLIGAVNTVLGGILGAANAIIVLLVIAVFAHVVVTFSAGSIPWVSSQIFEQSFVMRFFYRITQF